MQVFVIVHVYTLYVRENRQSMLCGNDLELSVLTVPGTL